MKISSVVLASLIVGAAGALAATLFAPEKGSKTRKQIADKGQEYKDYLRDNYHNLADSVAHPFEDMHDQTIRLSKKALQEAQKIKEEALQKIK